jgi:hypothetical protein
MVSLDYIDTWLKFVRKQSTLQQQAAQAQTLYNKLLLR